MQTIRSWSQPLHIPTSAFRPLNIIDPIIETTSTLVVEHRIMGKAHPHRMLAVISQTLCFFD